MEDFERRLLALEEQKDKLKPILKKTQKQVRSLRAFIILGAFVSAVLALSLDNLKVSKSEGVTVSLGDIKMEAVVAGLVAASLVMDQDTGQAKAIQALIDRVIGVR